VTNHNDLVATTAAKNIKGACSNDQSATRDYLTAPKREHFSSNFSTTHLVFTSLLRVNNKD
jgi:hypothetical protein